MRFFLRTKLIHMPEPYSNVVSSLKLTFYFAFSIRYKVKCLFMEISTHFYLSLWVY